MSASSLPQHLRKGLSELGLYDLLVIAKPLAAYCELVREWNSAINLTAARTPEEIADTLALTALSPLGAGLAVAPGTRVLDLGSGAGNPGIALALAVPGAKFALIEANGRKVGFLRHAVAVLELRNVQVVQGRAEDLGHDPAWREGAGLAVCRGIASSARTCELALPFLARGGEAWLYVSRADGEGVVRNRPVIGALGAGSVRVVNDPLGSGVICVVTKEGSCGEGFPRPEHLAKRRPLFR